MCYLAHFDQDTGKEQCLKEHINQVSDLCYAFGNKINLGFTSKLIGLIHDSGKANKEFTAYLRENNRLLRKTDNHSTCGARYVFEKLNTNEPLSVLTAQLIALAVCCHHSGLCDCLSVTGELVFDKRLYPEKEIYFEETISNFLEKCCSQEEAGDLFTKSIEEIKELFNKISLQNSYLGENGNLGKTFYLGLITRYLLSCLLDADRYDAYCFSAGIPTGYETTSSKLWDNYIEKLELNHLELSKNVSEINIKRKEISEACKAFSLNTTGAFRLYVPTGGGKTLSSLRYALHAAKEGKKERIFYIAPFRAILDQNANVINNILKDEKNVLEHHSDIVCEDDDYRLLTERWNSPIVLTTAVQFFNTLFHGNKRSTRRMHSLANSIIIFDEAQSIPIKCIHMFNLAVNFLTDICNCSVIICTATQPHLTDVKYPIRFTKPTDMVKNIDDIFTAFKRTSLTDLRISEGYSSEELANAVLEKTNSASSVLVIFNTKTAAANFYKAVSEGQNEIPVYLLTTALCPKHRVDVLDEIKVRLDKKLPVICVSTQLIEAGVDISFSCVFRSLAGLDSIAQAAGRCNRNGADEVIGNVYIFNSNEENLTKLKDIQHGQDATIRFLHDYKNNSDQFKNEMLTPQAIERYYKHYYENMGEKMNFTVSGKESGLHTDVNLVDLLSFNMTGRAATEKDKTPKWALRQAFETAGKLFEMINEDGMSVLVGYGEGKQLIDDLLSSTSVENKYILLRKLQRFSVHLYPHQIDFYRNKKVLHYIEDMGVWVLDSRFYDLKLGVTSTQSEMDLLLS